MKIRLPFSVGFSKPFSGKDGRKWVKLEGILLGYGIFSTLMEEKYVPDSIEGTLVTAVFQLGISKDFKPYLRLVEIVDNADDVNTVVFDE